MDADADAPSPLYKKGKKGKKGLKSAEPQPIPIQHLDPVMPRDDVSRADILHATIGSGLLTGQFFDTKIYAYSCRTALGAVKRPRYTFAHSALLKYTSDCFVILLSGTFAEGRRTSLDASPSLDKHFSTDCYDYQSDSDLEDAEDEEDEDACIKNSGLKPESVKLDDLDERPAAASAEPNSITTPQKLEEGSSCGTRQNLSDAMSQTSEVAGLDGRTIFFESVAFNTLQAFVFYVFTGKIEFAPLRSQLASSQGQNAIMQRQPQEHPHCSPKSMYRLAHMYDIRDLQDIALKDIKSKLSGDNILAELFSSFTSRYPEVQKVEVEFLLKHGFTPSIIAEMPNWMAKIAAGSLGALSGDVLTLLFREMARNISRSSANCWHCGYAQ